MAVTLTKLSASVAGKRILVGSGSSAVTQIHTAQIGTAFYDQIWLYVYNGGLGNSDLYVQCGSGSAIDTIVTPVPNKAGRFMVLDGYILNTSQSISAYANSASVVTVDGYVFTHS